MHDLIFQTERLIVRKYTIADLENFQLLNGDESVMRYIRPVLSPEESIDFLHRNIQLYSDYPLLGRWAVLDRNDIFVGSFAVIHIPGSMDIQLGYALLQPYWGKGYASELTRHGVHYCIRHNIDPLYAVTEAANIASQHVLLKNGFVLQHTHQEGDRHLHRYLLDRSGIKK